MDDDQYQQWTRAWDAAWMRQYAICNPDRIGRMHAEADIAWETPAENEEEAFFRMRFQAEAYCEWMKQHNFRVTWTGPRE